ncbi:AAA family ATPase [Rhodococcus hoagii]|nr:AAA family ATPase [Prescottella equi]NKS10200.1 AAA family ATPase [Prescottella equi]NKS10259.1 AAA family ATPase [Prescottella equi]NKS35250.1 AAA family ATPase [Prescottella equi]NKS62097.1 AAA family ATPase [Prescottella equi]
MSARTAAAPQRDAEALRRVIAVINGKGGVFKTTLAANIGGLLAASEYKVLIVDLDPQGNLAEDLGYTGTEVDDEGRNLAQALAFGEPLAPVRDVRPNLDVAAGGAHLEAATAALTSRSSKDPVGARLALATALAPIAEQYDMILLDCPPGDETLQTAAAAAARWLLIPVKSDASSRKGMAAVVNRLNAVLDDNQELDLLGVVLTGIATSATTVQKRARNAIAEAFGGSADVVFDKTVRHSEATAQATRERGLLVHELDEFVRNGPKWYEVLRGDAEAQNLAPRSSTSVADDLLGVTEEVVRRITEAETEEVAS